MARAAGPDRQVHQGHAALLPWARRCVHPRTAAALCRLTYGTAAFEQLLNDRRTAGRAQLRHRLLEAGVTNPPDWDGRTVDGPQEFADANGTTWFGYWATLTTPEPPNPTRSRHPSASCTHHSSYDEATAWHTEPVEVVAT